MRKPITNVVTETIEQIPGEIHHFKLYVTTLENPSSSFIEVLKYLIFSLRMILYLTIELNVNEDIVQRNTTQYASTSWCLFPS